MGLTNTGLSKITDDAEKKTHMIPSILFYLAWLVLYEGINTFIRRLHFLINRLFYTLSRKDGTPWYEGYEGTNVTLSTSPERSLQNLPVHSSHSVPCTSRSKTAMMSRLMSFDKDFDTACIKRYTTSPSQDLCFCTRDTNTETWTLRRALEQVVQAEAALAKCVRESWLKHPFSSRQ